MAYIITAFEFKSELLAIVVYSFLVVRINYINRVISMDNETLIRIKEKLKSLPMSPGVYLMKNSDGKIIYVGKSKALKNRVSSYFVNSKSHNVKTKKMVSNVYDFDYMVTDSEVEALILECNLIKKYMPKYNILLKDDKQYPYIKITSKEEYPRIFITRKLVKDGSKYFGPYMSASNTKETLEVIKKLFKIRSCNKVLPRDIGKDRPCLYYHIGQCSAPCANKISKEEYSEMFSQIASVLNGNYSVLTDALTEKMYTASENLEFEKAAGYRDRINHLKALDEKQKIISSNKDNRDIIGLYKDANDACVQVFYMRGGKMLGSEHHIFENCDDSDSELILSFVKQFYFNSTNLPKEILIPVEIEDKSEIEQWLSERKGSKVSLIIPKRGDKANSVAMVSRNAEETLKIHKFKRDKEQTDRNEILSSLMKVLNLKNVPHRIESYDISNISGSGSIGVCVVYNNAKPLKSAYRKFNIKTVEGANDYESTREVIFRRICEAYKEDDLIKEGKLDRSKAKFLPLPDLILLDGGKGHVNFIRELFDTMGEDIPVYGLVKDDKHRTRALTDSDSEFVIDNDSELFKFLTRLQDEVHRFAITAFRKKHEKSNVHSELDDIPGIGPKKRNRLLMYFTSVNRIKTATYEELCTAVDKRAARSVYNYFHDEK